MTDFLRLVIIGLATGGVYAMIAVGIVAVYRGSGVVSFAQSGLVLLSAIIFVELRDPVGVAGAIAVAVAAAAVGGVVIQFAVMWPMRRSSPLTRVVATLAVLGIAQQAASLKYPLIPAAVNTWLPSEPVKLPLDLIVGFDRILTFGIAVVLTAVLWVFYRYTRLGLATTGVATNERATAALGWSPQLIGAFNWGLGGALAGIAGVLVVPLLGISSTGLALTIVPALAAALVGGFASFPLTLAGALAIGVMEAESTRFISSPGWPSAAPFLVIIVLLVIRGRSLPLRGHVTDRLPRLGSGRMRPSVIVATVALAFVSLFVFGVSWADSLSITAVASLLCLAFVVSTGYAGQLNLAVLALAGVSALISSRLADTRDFPFLLALLAGVVCTVPVGLLVAVPALRTRGVNLAIATLGLGVVINGIILGNPTFTGGVEPGTVVDNPSLFGFEIDSLGHPQRWAGFTLAVLAVCAILVANLRRGRVGRRLVAVRDNERAAASVGVSVLAAKLYAFGVSTTLAALAGVLLAFRNTHISYEQYDVFSSIRYLLLSVLGGIGFIAGAVMGGASASEATVQQVLANWVTTGDKYLLVTAVLALFVLITNPDGVVGDVLLRFRQLARGHKAADTIRTPESPTPDRTVRAPVAPNRGAFELKHVTMRFGGTTAVDDLSFRIESGEVLGLIGPNGAGKTTVIDIASGLLRGYEGSVVLGGDRFDRLSAGRRAQRGVRRSFQSLELFDDLTVAENVATSLDTGDLKSYFRDLVWPGKVELPDNVLALLEQFGLHSALDRRPDELSYGKRRLLGLVRAIASAPSFALLDEPASGLGDDERVALGDHIRRLADESGVGVLLVEHDVSTVMRICDRVLVLNFGRQIALGTPVEVRSNPMVIEAYLGTGVPTEAQVADNGVTS